jgi:hypothetical protein
MLKKCATSFFNPLKENKNSSSRPWSYLWLNQGGTRKQLDSLIYNKQSNSLTF